MKISDLPENRRRAFRGHGNRNHVVWMFVLILLAGSGLSCRQSASDAIGTDAALEALKHSGKASVFYLDNGLEVILAENHAHPMITAFVIVKTGSSHEDEATNGAAHFLEHLLFNGTKLRTQKQLYDEMDFYGGYNNAHTGPDYTNFMILMPKEFIAQGMDIQADMLFNSTLPPDKFEKERGIVIEEIGKDSDRPEYQVNNLFNRTMYRNTPYSRPVLGTTSTIANLSRERVLEYYKTWYVPNNMRLMVIGDFSTPEMFQLVREKYGPYPPGPLPEQPEIAIQPQGSGEIFRANAAGTIPPDRKYLTVGYALPPVTSEEFQALQLLTEFLGGRPDSRLNTFFQKEQYRHLVNHVEASLEFNAHFSTLKISAELPATADENVVLRHIREVVESMADWPVAPEQLRSAKIARATKEIFLEEKLHYYGIMKAGYLAAGGYAFLRENLNRMVSVTPAAIQRAAIQHLRRRVPVATLMSAPVTSADTTRENATDRYAQKTLENGITVTVHQNASSRIVGLHLAALDRSAAEGPEARGLAEILQRMLLEGGTTRFPENKLLQQFESLGAEVKFFDSPFIPYDDYYNSPRFAYIRIKVVDTYLPEALALLAGIVQNAALPQTKFDRAKKEVRRLAASALNSTPRMAERLFYDTLFRENPGFGRVLGDTSVVSRLQLEQVKQFYADFYNPANLQLTVSGNLPPDSMLALVQEHFGSDWGNAGWRAPQKKLAFAGFGRTVRRRLGKRQSYIYLANPIETVVDDPAALTVLMQIFSDRLAFQLREKQGLAYSIGARAEKAAGLAWYRVRMGTRPENISSAVAGIRVQIRKMRSDAISSREFEKTVNALLGRRGMRRLDRVSQAYFIAMQVLSGNDPAEDERFGAALKAVTLARVRRLAQEVFRRDDPLVVIVE